MLKIQSFKVILRDDSQIPIETDYESQRAYSASFNRMVIEVSHTQGSFLYHIGTYGYLLPKTTRFEPKPQDDILLQYLYRITR